MKATQKTAILANLEANKDFQKNLKKLSHYTPESFLHDALQYVKAIKEGRVICSIGSVSTSGMSRTMKFISCEKGIKGGRCWYSNYFCMFVALGFTESRAKDHCFTISGCGMDMVFHTNYSIMHELKRMGIITKKQCESLCQATPVVI